MIGTKTLMAQDAMAEAEGAYAQALMDPETPEQAAVRLRKARMFSLTPEQTPSLTPDEEATAKAKAINWATLYAEAPTLTDRLSEPAFANLVKNDLSSMTTMEKMLWKLAPDVGEKDTAGGVAGNAFARGGFMGLVTGLFGSMSDQEANARELDRIRRIEQEMAEGKDVSRHFVTAEDETGTSGLAAFKADKERIKNMLTTRIHEAAKDTARRVRFASLFPEAKATREMMAQEGVREAVQAFMNDPLTVLTDVGVSAMTQQAPQLLSLPVLGAAGGLPAQIGATFAFSAEASKQSKLMESLAEEGVDLTDPEAIAAAYADPTKRDTLAKAVRRAERYAAGPALLDAASVGLAGKMLVPKSATRSVLDSAYKREFANMALQMPLQGTMGGAGEALGQYMADGEISSWADVVSEFVGEHFTAPFEVLSTGVKARATANKEQAKAVTNAEALSALKSLQTATGQIDPETTAEFQAEVAKRAKVETVRFDAESFHQLGLDEKFAGIPEVAQQMPQALATGGVIEVPTTTLINSMLPADENGDLLSIASVGDTPSVAEATEVASSVEAETTQQMQVAVKLNNPEFNAEVSGVGKAVGAELRHLGVTREEARGIQALVQLHVASTAKQLGMSPKAFWERYGAHYLGEPDVEKGPNGSLVAKTEYAKDRITSQGSNSGSLKQESNGDFFPTLRIVARWKTANRSTLLHETGHMFLDMRMRLAEDLMTKEERSSQEQGMVDAVHGILQWLGVDSLDKWNALTNKERAKCHEKFARSFEAYMMAGKPPTESQKILRVFRDFARWLKEIYVVLANIKGAELTDETRDMFDSLFVSQETVREAAMRQAVDPLFFRPEEASLTAQEWRAYQQARADVLTKAEAEVSSRNERMRRTVKSLRQELLRELRRSREGYVAEIRAETEKAVKASKVYKAWNGLVNGVEVDGEPFRLKLCFEDLKQIGYSDEQIKKLHDARVASPQKSRQPLPIGDIAEAFGYANANEMVDDLLSFPDATKVIEARTVARLVAEHPEMANEQTMREMADAALFNDAKITVLSTELTAMERKLNGVARSEGKAIDALAHEAVIRMKIAGLRPVVFARAANRAGRNARKAWAKGAVAEAIRFKRMELFQAALAKNAREELMGMAKTLRDFKKFKTDQLRGLDTRVLVVLQRALAGMGIFDEKSMHLNPPKMSFIEELRELETELGHGLDVAPELALAIATGDRSVLETVGGLRRFLDAIKTLEAQARREKTIDTLDGRRELAEVQFDAAEGIRREATVKGRAAVKRMEEDGKTSRFRDLFERFGLSHARAASLFAVLDGGWDGFLTKLFIYPSDKCGTTEESLKHRVTAKLDKIFSPVAATLTDRTKRTSKIFKHAFTTQQVFVLLLNYGNEGNRQRALATMRYLTGIDFFTGADPKDPVAMATRQATADKLMAAFFAEYLSDAHYDAAEQVWGLFEEIKDLTGKTHRRIVGREPEWVEARPLTVVSSGGKSRVLKGGYYTIAYDREASLSARQMAEVDTLKSLQPLFGKTGVADGWAKSRVQVFDRPLVLTSRALFEGLDEQIHYIAWAEFVNNANKLLAPKGELARAIHERYGAKFYDAICTWVQDVRNGNHVPTEVSDIFANELRRNVSLAGIGLNFGTAALQLIGITQSIAYLGGRWAGVGISEFLRRGPTGAFKAVAAKSAIMESRMRTQFREMVELQARLNGGTSSLRDKMMRAAYLPLTVVQMTVDLPTWLGAYEKAVFEGKSEEEAVATADRAVMNSQGSGRMQDLSKIERGGAWAKLFTVFYTFFNTALNLSVVSGKTERGMKRACSLLMVLVMQPVIESFVRSAVGAVGEDDDDWLEKAVKDAAKNTASFNLSLFVGLREFAAILDDYGYKGPAGLRKVTDTIRAGTSWERAWEKGEIDEATVKATVSAVGVWGGLPVTPINRAISGASALQRGDTDNPAVLFLGYSNKD